MSSSFDDMFKDMADAPAQGQTGNGIKVDGDFLIRVISTKGNKGYHGPRFIIEFEVLESTVPEQVPVGSKRSATIKWGDEKALSDIKAFALAAAYDALKDLAPRAQATEAAYLAYAAAGTVLAGEPSNVARQKLGGLEGDPFAGAKLRVTTQHTKTQKGFDFMKHRWAPVAS